MTTIWHSGRQGQARMQPTDAELGAQIRSRLQNFTASTSTVGTARDKTAVAMVRGQYPASRDLFSDAALVAVLREVRSGICTWCAYQVVSGEPAPTPTDGLRGLWGSMCSGCRNRRKRDRDVAEVAERELGLIAAATPRSTT